MVTLDSLVEKFENVNLYDNRADFWGELDKLSIAKHYDLIIELNDKIEENFSKILSKSTDPEHFNKFELFMDLQNHCCQSYGVRVCKAATEKYGTEGMSLPYTPELLVVEAPDTLLSYTWGCMNEAYSLTNLKSKEPKEFERFYAVTEALWMTKKDSALYIEILSNEHPKPNKDDLRPELQEWYGVKPNPDNDWVNKRFEEFKKLGKRLRELKSMGD